MSAYKDFLLGVEELVYTAIENGARDIDSVYAYVYLYEPRADRQSVQTILDETAIDDEYLQLYVA